MADAGDAGGRDRRGETKGTRAEQVMKVEQELFALYADPQLEEKPEQLSFRGGAYYSEVAVELINAIYNNPARRWW